MDVGLILLAIICSIIVVVVCVGVITSKNVQNKQEARIEQIRQYTLNNKEATFKIKDSLTEEDIKAIDSNLDIGSLMEDLYDSFLKLEKNLNDLNLDFDDILTQKSKEIYETRIKKLKLINNVEVIQDINLIGYSIINFNIDKIVFRVNIKCINYKKSGEIITSGSSSNYITQIFLITYLKIDNKWLIDDCDKVYEKYE